MSLHVLIFILIWLMTCRHTRLLCKMGQCKCPNVDEALDVCRAETLGYSSRQWVDLIAKQVPQRMLTCNFMEVHHCEVMVRVLGEPRMCVLRLWCEMIFLAHLAGCLVCQCICIFLLGRYVATAVLGVLLLIFISMFLLIHAVHTLAAFLA